MVENLIPTESGLSKKPFEPSILIGSLPASWSHDGQAAIPSALHIWNAAARNSPIYKGERK
jgi:hypothetical protein